MRGKRRAESRLVVEQRVANLIVKATKVFGSHDEAERWLARPAFGLDGRRPIDLLETNSGVTMVEAYLVRIEYGVYA